MFKTCPHCSLTLPLSSFDRDSTRVSGRHPYCKPCTKEIRAERYRRQKTVTPDKALRRGVVTPEHRGRVESSHQTKVCSRCKARKLLRMFSPSPRGRLGVASWCKACRVEWVGERRRMAR